MTSAQRMPLFDVGFEWLPKISGGWWTLSDVLIYVMIGYVLTVCVSSVFIEWKTGSRRPIFSALVLKRCLLTVCLLQQAPDNFFYCHTVAWCVASMPVYCHR